jgi:hypothetical protein
VQPAPLQEGGLIWSAEGCQHRCLLLTEHPLNGSVNRGGGPLIWAKDLMSSPARAYASWTLSIAGVPPNAQCADPGCQRGGVEWIG